MPSGSSYRFLDLILYVTFSSQTLHLTNLNFFDFQRLPTDMLHSNCFQDGQGAGRALRVAPFLLPSLSCLARRQGWEEVVPILYKTQRMGLSYTHHSFEAYVDISGSMQFKGTKLICCLFLNFLESYMVKLYLY